jgi:hypothetical protein
VIVSGSPRSPAVVLVWVKGEGGDRRRVDAIAVRHPGRLDHVAGLQQVFRRRLGADADDQSPGRHARERPAAAVERRGWQTWNDLLGSKCFVDAADGDRQRLAA